MRIKDFRAWKCQITEATRSQNPQFRNPHFPYRKGTKVRINQITIYGTNTYFPGKIKKQLNETKEVTKLTLYPAKDSSSYGVVKPETFKEYIDSWGFLSYTGTKEFLDPYFRFKLIQLCKIQCRKNMRRTRKKFLNIIIPRVIAML